MCSVRALLVVLLFTLSLRRGCSNREQNQACPPSSCGKIPNISHPFRLKNDPQHCGYKQYELACEVDNVTVLSLYSGKYHVQAINYNNYTIRVVDPGIQEANRSSIPHYFLSQSNFCDTYDGRPSCADPYHAVASGERGFMHTPLGDQELLFQHVVYLNCTHPVTHNPRYVELDTSNGHSGGYIYAVAGDLTVEEYFDVDCRVKLVSPTSLWGMDGNKSSYAFIHRALVYGFEISWLHRSCEDICSGPRSCFLDSFSKKLRCSRVCNSILGYGSPDRCGRWTQLRFYVKDTIVAIYIGILEIIKGRNNDYDYEGFTNYTLGLTMGHYVLPSILAARFLFGMTFFLALLIHKWKKRHLSMFENIEEYLQQSHLVPIRYSHNEIKKMAKGFKEKLGEGGFGTVFKGNLRSGPCVALKMLAKSKGKGEDFINEVATIGRVHHLNVVQLIGFCIEGSKQALVYEFMSNGSLDKFIFSKEGSIHLSLEKICSIAIGVARGIAYLHHGCEMKILHFDIKPHNILLDENFTPKISDFGLAKLYPVDNSIVTMTAARGTIGYMAPELFYKNIGGVSYKADVYSFGMLLMEMASNRKNLNPHVEHSSQLYFPFCIYDQLGKQNAIELEDVKEEEMKIAKKMIMVALWCIQLKPDDRPSMKEIVEMLEGDVENLEMPPKPSLYPHETIAGDQGSNSEHTMPSDFISSSIDPVEIVAYSQVVGIA